jgi:hypothetical protein
VWTEVPLSAVTLSTNATSYYDLYKLRLGMDLSSETGWLSCWMDSTLRLIWLPYARRGWSKTMYGRRVAIAREQQYGAAALTVLKFPALEAGSERPNVLHS